MKTLEMIQEKIDNLSKFPDNPTKTMDELKKYLEDNGATGEILVDSGCLCWMLHFSDSNHIGQALVHCKDGDLVIPYDQVDTYQYEILDIKNSYQLEEDDKEWLFEETLRMLKFINHE